jgi:hypothetical protein
MLSLLRRLKIIFMSELEGVKQLIAIVLLKEQEEKRLVRE